MSADPLKTSENDLSLLFSLQWLSLWGLLAILGLAYLLNRTQDWCEQEATERSRALMAEQIENIKQDKTNCLIQPDPQFIDELLADETCASKIHELILGSDVSNPRLTRLKELPNLKNITLLSAANPDQFLKVFRDSAAVEQLSLVYCKPSHQGIKYIASLPNLKKFGLCVNQFAPEEWKPLCKALPNCKCNLIESKR